MSRIICAGSFATIAHEDTETCILCNPAYMGAPDASTDVAPRLVLDPPTVADPLGLNVARAMFDGSDSEASRAMFEWMKDFLSRRDGMTAELARDCAGNMSTALVEVLRHA